MKECASTCNDNKAVIGVVGCASWIVGQVLSNSRIVHYVRNVQVIAFAAAGKVGSVLRWLLVSDVFRHMLFDPLFQPLGCATYVPTITVAQELVNNVALLRSR